MLKKTACIQKLNLIQFKNSHQIPHNITVGQIIAKCDYNFDNLLFFFFTMNVAYTRYQIRRGTATMSEYPHSTDWSAITVAGGNRDSMFVIH